jgi:hypothetical protein
VQKSTCIFLSQSSSTPSVLCSILLYHCHFATLKHSFNQVANMSEYKNETTVTASPQLSSHEYTPSSSSTLQAHKSNVVSSIGFGTNVLSLLTAITILGTAGDILSVYNTTHLGEDFFLPLWPTDFDIRPSVALVTCAAIITVSSIVGLVGAKVPAVRSPSFFSSI